MKPGLERIAYVLRVFPKYSETFIVTELAELRQRGIALRILALQSPADGVRHEIVAKAGLDKITCYQKEEFLAVLQEFRPQLLHAHFATEATAVALDLAANLELPFTFTAHGYDIHRKPPKDFSARAAVARAVVSVSQANAEYLEKHFSVPAAHIRVIPCGIDTQFFRPAEPVAKSSAAGAESGSGPPLILCVARLVEVKNLEVLLRACAWLRDQNLVFRCVVLGEGPCRASLEETSSALGLDEQVQLLGAAEQGQVRAWWQKAAIGVLSSDNEGMPVSLMEAAACGVPVVATAVGGIPELVLADWTGFLVPPRAPVALAESLARLLRDGKLRETLGAAARQRAEEKFSVVSQVDQLTALWSEILASGSPSRTFISDPFDAVADPALPTLRLALDPVVARQELKRHLVRIGGKEAKFRLKSIRVVRHKPGRRCVVEYEGRLERPGFPTETVALVGKSRVRRFGKEGFRLQEKLWQSGFDSQSADGISVPEPIGVIPLFQMWLQRKVSGPTATRALAGQQGEELARRIASAIHKLHQARVPTERCHTLEDELRILHECLEKAAAAKPDWRERLARIGVCCDRLGASVPPPVLCGIHRDFYPAQVVISDAPNEHQRLYLIDFDLYSIGDPALDVGNFIGHMIEQGLREFGDPCAMAKQEQALEERFVQLTGEEVRRPVHAFTTLTLVRHIYLSTQFAAGQALTGALIELCEERLGVRG